MDNQAHLRREWQKQGQQPRQLVLTCRTGHAYTAENSVYQRTSHGSVVRKCRLCHNERSKRYARRRRAAT